MEKTRLRRSPTRLSTETLARKMMSRLLIKLPHRLTKREKEMERRLGSQKVTRKLLTRKLAL